MGKTERLPRVEAQFNVIAPEGGYRRRLRAYDVGYSRFFDIEIENHDRVTFWLRITPVRKEVVLDPKHAELYLINKASAIFINHEGGEELTNRPVVDVWVSINTDVQAGGEPAGTLKMWEFSLDMH